MGHVTYLKGKEKTHRVLVRICEGKILFEDLCIEGRIISKRILKKNWMGGHSTSCSIKCGAFVTNC